MFWFRIGVGIGLAVVLLWVIGETSGILVMSSNGSKLQSIELDPAKNGTLAIYVLIMIMQVLLGMICIFGIGVAFRVWRNKYQMDSCLRRYFIIWVALWSSILLANFGVAVYALIRVKDPQGQLGYMYEMFQRTATDIKFISNFERFQRDHQCCGIYGPDDWLIVQLRASPGGTQQLQNMDYGGYQQNPSTGRCQMGVNVIPTGCGPQLLREVNSILGMYGALTLVEVCLGLITGGLAWYCFFFWIQKEVVVIPEDDLSNVIIIEPEDNENRSSTSSSSRSISYVTATDSRGNPILQSARYLPRASYLQGRTRTGIILSSTGPGIHTNNKSKVIVVTQGQGQDDAAGPASQSPRPPLQIHTSVPTSPINALSSRYIPQHNQRDPVDLSPPRTITQRFLSAAGPFDAYSRRSSYSLMGLPPAMQSALLHDAPFRPSSHHVHHPGVHPYHSHVVGSNYYYDHDHHHDPHYPNHHHHNGSTYYLPHHPPAYFSAPPSFHYNPAHHEPHHGHEPHHDHDPGPSSSPPRHHHPPPKKETPLQKQLNALGGKVLQEVHFDHTLDKEGPTRKASGEKHKPTKPKHATLAIVRKVHKEPPPPPPGHHGQTGHLAEDIAEMSGGHAVKILDDVIIPTSPPKHHHNHHHKEKKNPQDDEVSVAGIEGQVMVEDLLFPNHLKEAEKKKAKEAAKVKAEKETNNKEPAHYAKGGILAKEKAIAKERADENRGLPPAPHILPGLLPPEQQEHDHHHHPEDQGQGHHHHLGGWTEDEQHGHGHLGGGTQHHLGHHPPHEFPLNTHYSHPFLGGGSRYLPPGHHETGRYLAPGHHGGSRYLEPGGYHHEAHYLPPGHHPSRYLAPGHHEDHYLPPGHHEDHYLAPGHHEAHYLPQGHHEHAHYLGGSRAHTHGHLAGSGYSHIPGHHERAHYLVPSHHRDHEPGHHERAHYIPHHGSLSRSRRLESLRSNRRHHSSHHRDQQQQPQIIVIPQAVAPAPQPQHEHSRARSRPGPSHHPRNTDRTKTHVLYKNSKPIDAD